MGNISQDIIPHRFNLSASTALEYHEIYDIIKKVKDEEFPALNLDSCNIEDELNKVSKLCLSNEISIIPLKYSCARRLFC